MGELETNEELNIDASLNNDSVEDIAENSQDNIETESSSTAITEYKEVDEPCVALTIIGENRLSNAEIFVRRGFRYSLKTFFSAIALTIMNLFIQKRTGSVFT